MGFEDGQQRGDGAARGVEEIDTERIVEGSKAIRVAEKFQLLQNGGGGGVQPQDHLIGDAIVAVIGIVALAEERHRSGYEDQGLGWKSKGHEKRSPGIVLPNLSWAKVKLYGKSLTVLRFCTQ